ncbi:MAG: hypothetical protein GX621_05565, partial [Pirellulaceae bacterium]|nr:hypothetical protein [Pirellulaceae bacterium]
VYQTVPLAEYVAKEGRIPPVEFDRSGWFLVRAVTDLPKNYRFAMSAPYFVEVGGQPRISKQAAQFFVDWVYQRARELSKIEDPETRAALLEDHRKARDYWEDLLKRANAP